LVKADSLIPAPLTMEKFTVIIPTFNRCETLPHTLESCVAQRDADFRILVSDNCSTDDTRTIVKEFQERDPRVAYIQPPRFMGMSAHWEFALDQVQEGFVMLLGSDDALLPGAVSRARTLLMEHPSIKVLHSDVPIFHYPNSGIDDAGMLRVQIIPCEEIRQTTLWLSRVTNMTCAITELPYIYHSGWVHTEILHKIVKKTGRLIRSAIPDVYLAIAIATQIEEYLHVKPSFGMGGFSAKSNWAATTHPQGNRTLEDAYKTQNEIQFHPKIGYTRSVPLIVGECLLQAKDAGLLPPNFHIPWEKVVARAYLGFQSPTWSDLERQQNMESLHALSRSMGCSQVLDDAAKFPTVRQWATKTRILKEWYGRKSEGSIDTRLLGISGVHEAAQLAGTLQQAAASVAHAPFSIASASTEQLLAWGLLQNATHTENLRTEFQKITLESERRAGERDLAKAKLAAEHVKKKKTQPRSFLRSLFGKH
jgi:glycosyltransferase involved in cell wall biosynthesis